jgi:hypothetical protein
VSYGKRLIPSLNIVPPPMDTFEHTAYACPFPYCPASSSRRFGQRKGGKTCDLVCAANASVEDLCGMIFEA